MIINSKGIALAGIVFLAASLGLATRLPAQGDAVVVARRVATVASIAIQEYGLGVVNGSVVAPAELEEAKQFLDEARRAAESLPSVGPNSVTVALDSLVRGVAELKPADGLRRDLDGIRRRLELLVGVPLDPLPTAPPSLARGEALYRQSCSGCHGDLGRGDGANGRSLNPPPANLADAAGLAGTSPLDFFRKINVGVAGTAMPAFEGQLSLEERWALALYTSGLRFSAAERERADRSLRAGCPACEMLASDFNQTASLSDDSLRARLAFVAGGTHPDSEPASWVPFARTAGAVEQLGGDRRLEAQRTMEQAKAAVADAVQIGRQGDRQRAASRALEAYLVFERVEVAVRARDNRAATRVEQAFADLRLALGTGKDSLAVQNAASAVGSALDAALARHSGQMSVAGLFGQSLVIMLREGLEAILIIGALIAFLAKAGARERTREIGFGVLAAVIASLITAAGFATLWSYSTARREGLEGITMVVAAAVLFWVSYWLVSKIELRKWQAFVGAQMGRALSSGSAMALTAVAFLAVYREGFETVLFYAALYASGAGVAGASWGVTAGIVLGFLLLAVVYYAIQRYGVRLPLKPFFAVTSGLLYLMAFSFAGQGVAELQEAGYIPSTPLAWAPSIPFLGIFPTTQTLMIQLFLAVALLAALMWVFWLEPKAVRVKATVPPK